ncbi:MAG TPA: TIGR01777 family oxidoreductase [Bacteroidia bacterium]|nr:TIGR01777 family oxidoreductase [Bacteroidia bacterium]
MNKEVVLVTGGTGLIGNVLIPLLQNAGYEVIILSRSRKNENSFLWDIDTNFVDKKAIIKSHHLIHLAGASIADKPWSETRKKEIVDSRVNSAELMIKAFKQNHIELKTVVAASAIGYYGTETSEHIYTENDQAGRGFLAETCVEWEKATHQFQQIAQRLVQLRIGVVLDKNGGALKKMAQPIHFYAGAALGTGKQYMPWIHVYDLCNMILFALKNHHVNGTYNAVSSSYINNDEFTHAIGKALLKPIVLPAIPAIVLKTVFGEMANMLLEGSRVSNQKIKQAGFEFKYDSIDKALQHIYSGLN